MQAPASQRILQRLEWRVRHASDGPLSGDYRSAFRGRGREFDQVVEYAYGDDIRDIDWNVTARLGHPYRKKFVEERELTVVLLFEDSLTLQFGSGAKTRRETLLELASLFALLSANNRDRAGYWHATPQLARIRKPVRGRARVLGIAAALLGEASPDLEESGPVEIDWRRLLETFPRHSVMVWLGDFPPRPAPEQWPALRRRYEMVGVRVDDPWDRELPRSGGFAAVDPEAGRVLRFSPATASTRRRHADWVAERERRWLELFPSLSDRLVAVAGDDPLAALVRFMRRRSHGR